MATTLADAIAHALRDAGVRVVTHVPGFGGTEVFRLVQDLVPGDHRASFHEEVAFGVAHGAALTGARSALLVKAHGLAKAANAVVDSLASGTTAGLVVMVFDDPRGAHSDSIFDLAAFVGGLGVPADTVEPPTAYGQVMDAFARSEALALPVVLIVNADEINACSTWVPGRPPVGPPHYRRDLASHVVCPVLAPFQHEVLSLKMSGGHWKREFLPRVRHVPDDFPESWQTTLQQFTPLFTVFREVRGRIVTGDTSTATLFAFPPFECIDLATYMGGSLPLAIGAHLAGYTDVWAVTGDFSFVAAGHLGLVEAFARGIPLKVLLFRNDRADATGGQRFDGVALDRILDGHRASVRRLASPDDRAEAHAVLSEAAAARDLRIVVADYR